jgi:hypothetical protein
MRMKRIFAASVLTLAAGAASAGWYRPFPVTIDFDGRFASGDMNAARTAENPTEFIGCGVRHFAGGTAYAFCQAGFSEAEGQFALCTSFDPALVDAVKAIASFSYIQFGWDADFNCTQIGNSTQSFYLPDLKTKK